MNLDKDLFTLQLHNCTHDIATDDDNSFESFLECLKGHVNYTQASLEEDDEGDLVSTIGVGLVFGLIALVTVVGNFAVLVAIWMDKNLHSLPNYLIFSLTVAHLIVGCIVMPFAAAYEVAKFWLFGEMGCVTWLFFDVLSGTALMLHLVAIAVDRYWSLTSTGYANRTALRRLMTTLFTVWVLALVITMPQLLWKDESWQARIEAKECSVNHDEYFLRFVTLPTLVVPLGVVLVLFWKIFQAERRQIQKTRFPIQNMAETSLITTTAYLSIPCQDETALVAVRNTRGDYAGAGSEQPSRIRNSEMDRTHPDQRLSPAHKMTLAIQSQPSNTQNNPEWKARQLKLLESLQRCATFPSLW